MALERTSGIVKSLGITVSIAGSILFGLLGSTLGYFLEARDVSDILLNFTSGAIVWIAIVVAIGVRIVPQAEVWGVERLGQYHRMLRSGIRILLFPNLVDQIKESNKASLKDERLDLYKDEVNNKFDFTNGSAAVKVQVWHRLAQRDENGGDTTEENLQKWLYAKTNPTGWIEEQLDDFIRPQLQECSIDEAQIKKQSVAQMAKEEARSVNGINITGSVGREIGRLLITDIVLPQDVIDARTETLKGQREAQKTQAIGKGYVGAILAIMKDAAEAGNPITWEQALEVFDKQRALETIGRTGANITLVGQDVGGILKTLEVGNKGGGRGTPSQSPNRGGNRS